MSILSSVLVSKIMCPISVKSLHSLLKWKKTLVLNNEANNFKVYFKVVSRSQEEGCGSGVRWCGELRERRVEKTGVCVTDFSYSLCERIRVCISG